MKMDKKIEQALTGLLQKYDVKADRGLNLMPGWNFIGKELLDSDVPLLCWRHNRKFIELKNLVSNNVIEHVCMLRFCSFGSKEQSSLESLIYKELDLCEFLGQGKVISMHSVISDGLAGNIIVKLDNGIIGSVEVGAQVPEGSPYTDRHEIIARRGVASDLSVDTQVPQSSVYTYTTEGKHSYKDVDNELFGFDENSISQIRAAFDVQKNPGQVEELRSQHSHLSLLVKTAIKSNLKQQKIEVK